MASGNSRLCCIGAAMQTNWKIGEGLRNAAKDWDAGAKKPKDLPARINRSAAPGIRSMWYGWHPRSTRRNASAYMEDTDRLKRTTWPVNLIMSA